jgi:hypothetical protein
MDKFELLFFQKHAKTNKVSCDDLKIEREKVNVRKKAP